MPQKGIMINEDSDHFIHERMDIIEQVDRAYLEKFIDQYKNSDVTDFLMCIYGLLTAYPSAYKTSYADKYHKTEELGKPVDYKKGLTAAAHAIWEEKNLDMYAIWIEECRKIGIHPWLSYRMNDAHCHFEVPNALISDQFYEHLDDWARVRHREKRDHYDRCRDFEIEGVREEFLNCLQESLNRYDPYGIELDFQREFDCFRIGHEWTSKDLMTEFVGKIKSIVSKAEEKWGHKIKIASRCHANPVYCMELGFDILRWAELGLIDMYIPSPRWYTTDNDMPIALWKQLLKPYGVELAGAIEINIANKPQSDGVNWLPPVMQTVSTTLGSAANILSQGADKVYLFNYMDTTGQMCSEEENFNTNTETLKRPDKDTPFLAGNGYKKILTTIGSLKKIGKEMRRHIVTYSDKNPLWHRTDIMFPSNVSKSQAFFVRVATGCIPVTSRIVLKIGMTEPYDETNMDVFVNSTAVTFLRAEQAVEPVLTTCPIYAFEIPMEGVQSEVQIVEIAAKDFSFDVDYVEIQIIPKK